MRRGDGLGPSPLQPSPRLFYPIPCMMTPTRGVRALRLEPGNEKANADMVEATLAATGDAHAFERLYRAHVARVHALARRMLSEEEADEVTQDVFVRAWQKLATVRGEAAFGTWLHRLSTGE